MPCFTIQTSTVELGKGKDLGLMAEALASIGEASTRYGQRLCFGQNEFYDADNGVLQITQSRNVAEIKRAYSHAIVKQQAKKMGWQLKQVGPNKYQAVRR